MPLENLSTVSTTVEYDRLMARVETGYGTRCLGTLRGSLNESDVFMKHMISGRTDLNDIQTPFYVIPEAWNHPVNASLIRGFLPPLVGGRSPPENGIHFMFSRSLRRQLLLPQTPPPP